MRAGGQGLHERAGVSDERERAVESDYVEIPRFGMSEWGGRGISGDANYFPRDQIYTGLTDIKDTVLYLKKASDPCLEPYLIFNIALGVSRYPY